MKIYLTIIMLSICAMVWSNSFVDNEQNDYGMVESLYSNSAFDAALRAISQYMVKYPNGIYKNHFQYLKSEILFQQAKYPEAILNYDVLISITTDIFQMADATYKKGLSYYYSNEFQRAQEQFQSIKSDFGFGVYPYEAAKWMARIFAHGGQYYSSEINYNLALEYFTNDTSLKLELVNVLLKQNRMEPVWNIITTIPRNDSLYPKFLESVLSHYLENEKYDDFDDLMYSINSTDNDVSVEIKLLFARRFLIANRINEARQYIDILNDKSEQAYYINAIIEKENGNVNKADSMFAVLVGSSDAEIATLSYLERLKILYDSAPLPAYAQLTDFINVVKSQHQQGDMNYLAGYFAFKGQEFEQAIRHFNRARTYQLNKYQMDKIDIMIAESWFGLNVLDQAEDRFNRYLNIYPQGVFRDRAWFMLGMIAMSKKQYDRAKSNLSMLQEQHPNSSLMADAQFYLGEIEFFNANYNVAINIYAALLHDVMIDDPILKLRLAQSHYFNHDYNAALTILRSIDEPSKNYDAYLLEAGIHFNSKRYQQALVAYQTAESKTTIHTRKTEAKSYIALTLYQLGRFVEASELYLQLSGTQANPDTYLFLAAKSAKQAGSISLALELYEEFLNSYPESDHINAVLSDIATIDYNQGRFVQAFNVWVSTLKNYKTAVGFNQEDLQQLRTIFNGLEMCLSKIEGLEQAETILELIDSFGSDYIKFELQYILVKLYASQGAWESLLAEAEEIQAINSHSYKSEIELLMVDSLIKLNLTSEADTLLSSIYAGTQSNAALLKWADLCFLGENYVEAIQKYTTLYLDTNDPEVWLKILDSSQRMGFQGFDEYWSMGNSNAENYPASQLLYLEYLLKSKNYEPARMYAYHILEGNYSDMHYAQAYMIVSRIEYETMDYHSAIRTLTRILDLYPDFPDVVQFSTHLMIMSLLRNGAITEAQMMFLDKINLLNDDQKFEINQYLESIR